MPKPLPIDKMVTLGVKNPQLRGLVDRITSLSGRFRSNNGSNGGFLQ